MSYIFWLCLKIQRGVHGFEDVELISTDEVASDVILKYNLGMHHSISVYDI